MNPMTHNTSDPPLWKLFRDDLRQGGLPDALRREVGELKHQLLSDSERDRLEEMGTVTRFLSLCWWLFRAVLLHMSPLRRVLVVVGVVLIAASGSGDTGLKVHVPGGVALLAVLMLELKDKLLLRRELEGGHAVQRAMRPPTSPKVPGWEVWLFTRSANEVGGDLLDFLALDERRYGIVLGDVAGKGLSAALLGVKLQATLQAFARESPTLGLVAERLNSLFCQDGPSSYFASLVFLEFSPENGIVRAVNAGHLPPLLVRSESIDTLPRGGAALGILKNAEYPQQEISMVRGDQLVLISDGVTEAENDAGEQYGEDHLKEYLFRSRATHTSELGEGLVRAVEHHMGNARQKDDITIAVLKRVS